MTVTKNGKTPLHRYLEGQQIIGLSSEGAKGIADAVENEAENLINLVEGINDQLDNDGYDLSYLTGLPGMDEKQAQAFVSWAEYNMAGKEAFDEFTNFIRYPLGKIYEMLDEITENGTKDIMLDFDAVDTEGHIMEGLVKYQGKNYFSHVSFYQPGTWEENVVRDVFDRILIDKDVERVSEWLGDRTASVSWKWSGLKITLNYDNGRLQNVLDGKDDITESARAFVGVPDKIAYKGKLKLEGVASITYEEMIDFTRHNGGLSPVEDIIRNIAKEECFKDRRECVTVYIEKIIEPGITTKLRKADNDIIPDDNAEYSPNEIDSRVYDLRYFECHVDLISDLGFEFGSLGVKASREGLLNTTIGWEEDPTAWRSLVDGIYIHLEDLSGENSLKEMVIPFACGKEAVL